MSPWSVVSWCDRRISRIMDSALTDFFVGNWFERPIKNAFERHHAPKVPRPRRYIDADGNPMAAPEESA